MGPDLEELALEAGLVALVLDVRARFEFDPVDWGGGLWGGGGGGGGFDVPDFLEG